MTQYYSLVLRSFELNTEDDYNSVFFYKTGDDLSATAESLWRAFVFENLIAPTVGPDNAITGTESAAVLQWIANCVSADIGFSGVYVYNLFDPTDFFDNSFASVVGGVRGANLSTTTAIPFRTTQESRLIRRGRKRFPGAPGPDYDNVTNRWDPSYLDILQQTAIALGASIRGSSNTGDPQLDVQFQPIVVGRVKCGEDCNGYRLPLLLEIETRHFVANRWEYGDSPSTQKSRQNAVRYL